MDTVLRQRLKAIEARLEALERRMDDSEEISDDPLQIAIEKIDAEIDALWVKPPCRSHHCGAGRYHVLDSADKRVSGNEYLSKAEAEALAEQLNAEWQSDATAA